MAKAKVNPVRDDGAYIRNYDRWNAWPCCPVKRRNSELRDKNLGVLLSDQNHADAVRGKAGAKFIVYHVYLFMLPKTKAEWDAAPKTEYNTLNDLLDDGWMVD